MKRTLLILLAVVSAGSGHCQYLQLVGDTARTALLLDVGRVWNYNLYEHTRWGGGLLLTTHPQYLIFSQLDAECYLGYGIFDEQWKYGVALAEHVRGSSHNSVFYQRAQKDYFAAANRHIDNPWSGTALLGGFMSRRMVETHGVTLGYRLDINRWRWAAEISFGERGQLFDEYHLLYANQTPIDLERFGCLRLLLRHSCGFSTQLEYFSDWKTLRLLADYRRSISLSYLGLDIYAQGGASPRHNGYIDMFDLGGIYSAPLYLEQGFSTVRPNEFTANTFMLLNLRMRTAKPLYSIYSSLFNLGSNPTPFIGFKSVWGMMWDQDANGQRPWLTSSLQAPYKGLFEASLGVIGIIRWGAVDWGAAVAYRITPSSALYHHNSVTENLSFLITATLLQ